ncbi:MAG: hypothetical protein HDR50_11970 [Desulfovibrio sp.]|uniref:hypothetical protein n=1 Tax=Desulfovibrio sp. TaxID=885 RepID=UPI001A74ABB8|nr:hypothetical protein [Desulfovibrio sp.]MBD5418328.1 hypothetical protein [Desulfovibrio sp.]
MDTSNQQIHISIDTIVNDEWKVNKVNISFGEDKISIDTNKQHQDANEKVDDSKQKDDKQEQKSKPEQKVEENNGQNGFSTVIREMFVFEDETEEGIKRGAIPNPEVYGTSSSEQSTTTSSKDNLQGGGEKSISPNQVNLIKTMATERGMNPEQVSNSMYQKSLNELKGHEADSIIKSMKNKRRQ